MLVVADIPRAQGYSVGTTKPKLSLRQRWRQARQNPIVDTVATLAGAIAIALVVQWLVVKPYKIPTESMDPTFLKGDRVIVTRFLYRLTDPKRGEVIVFHPNGENGQPAAPVDSVSSENYVKRLIGVPGDVLGAVDGRLYRCSNGTMPADPGQPELTAGCAFAIEPYVHDQPTGACGTETEPFGPIKLESDQYFFMGDNRTNSWDSRCWGPVRRSQLIGRSFMNYWPIPRIRFY